MKKILLGLLVALTNLSFVGSAVAQDKTKNLLILPTVDETEVLSEGMVNLFNKTITKAVLDGIDSYKVYLQDTGTSVHYDYVLNSKVEKLTGDYCSLTIEIVSTDNKEVVKTSDATFTADFTSFRSACNKIATKLFPRSIQGASKSVDETMEDSMQDEMVPLSDNEQDVTTEKPVQKDIADTPEYIVLPQINLMVLRTELNAMVPRAAAERQVSTNVGGFDDWRLPTADELYLLYGYKEKLGKMKFQRYWASDCKKDNNGEYTEAWYLLIDEAFARAEMRKMTKNIRAWQCGVWMVRNIQ